MRWSKNDVKHVHFTYEAGVNRRSVKQASYTYDAGFNRTCGQANRLADFDRTWRQASILCIRSGARSNLKSSNHIIHTKRTSMEHEVKQAIYTYEAVFDRKWCQPGILYIRNGLRSNMMWRKHILNEVWQAFYTFYTYGTGFDFERG